MSDRDGEVDGEDETGGAVAEGAGVGASSGMISRVLVSVVTGWPLEGSGSALRSGTRWGTSGERLSASLKRGGSGYKEEEVVLRIPSVLSGVFMSE